MYSVFSLCQFNEGIVYLSHSKTRITPENRHVVLRSDDITAILSGRGVCLFKCQIKQSSQQKSLQLDFPNVREREKIPSGWKIYACTHMSVIIIASYLLHNVNSIPMSYC